jgi:hypothetical protein
MSTEANTGILLKEKVPGVKEYQSLRTALGWPTPHGDVVKKALINSLFCGMRLQRRHPRGVRQGGG